MKQFALDNPLFMLWFSIGNTIVTWIVIYVSLRMRTNSNQLVEMGKRYSDKATKHLMDYYASQWVELAEMDLDTNIPRMNDLEKNIQLLREELFYPNDVRYDTKIITDRLT